MSRTRATYGYFVEAVFLLKKFALFIGGTVAAVLIYRLLISQIISRESLIVPFIILWLLSAYIVLPRAHRFLSRLYLPNYFIGRTRTADGLLCDPINLAVLGNEETLRAAMKQAGWIEAEPLTASTSWKMFKASLLRQSYPSAPVSSLLLFNRKQDMAFQKEIDANPHARHHVRFWKTPKNWWLPGGYKADWLGAATYDRSVGLSLLTLQITHRIAEHIDEERDFVIDSLQDAKLVQKVKIVEHFTSAFRDRNGGGDQISTDGSLPFVHLK